MDDFVAALLCLPFIILPLIVLIAIISSKIRASEMVKEVCTARCPFSSFSLERAQHAQKGRLQA